MDRVIGSSVAKRDFTYSKNEIWLRIWLFRFCVIINVLFTFTIPSLHYSGVHNVTSQTVWHFWFKTHLGCFRYKKINRLNCIRSNAAWLIQVYTRRRYWVSGVVTPEVYMILFFYYLKKMLLNVIRMHITLNKKSVWGIFHFSFAINLEKTNMIR